ncbi:hypothetical protein [Streptomyces sp. NPDC019890]|uniref:hypothetical protein n=1 Tax=Streptomyces sp. NPDC019890 TaxID=3365064 RepID=UPI00384E14C0
MSSDNHPTSHQLRTQRSSRLRLALVGGAAALALLGSGAAFAASQAPTHRTGTAASSHTQEGISRGSDTLLASGSWRSVHWHY